MVSIAIAIFSAFYIKEMKHSNHLFRTSTFSFQPIPKIITGKKMYKAAEILLFIAMIDIIICTET